MSNVYVCSVRTQDTYSLLNINNERVIDIAMRASKYIVGELKNKITALADIYKIGGLNPSTIRLDQLLRDEMLQESNYAYQDAILSRLIKVMDKEPVFVDIPDDIDSADDFYNWIQSL
jgi:hypothetical protein